MKCEVFRRRDCPKVFGICPLDALDELSREGAGKVRIFSQRLLAASPSRIAENVDVWGPECQAVVPAGVSLPLGLVITRPRLGPDSLAFSMKQPRIPGGGHTNGLREHGGFSAACYAMQCLAPILVGGNSESGDGGRIILHPAQLLIEGHSTHQTGNGLFDGQVPLAKTLRLGDPATKLDPSPSETPN